MYSWIYFTVFLNKNLLSNNHFKAIDEFKLELQLGNAQFGPKSSIFFVLSHLEIWWRTFKNNGAPLLYYIKLCVSFQSRCEFKLEYSPETLNSGQYRWFFVPCDLENWRMTLKTIGHLFYFASSVVGHFVAINEFKLELQSENSQFGSKSIFFCTVWPSNLTDDLEK